MSSNGIRRFIFWMQYDGSRFPEMARGATGFGVMDLLHQVGYSYYNSAFVLKISYLICYLFPNNWF